MDYRHKRCHSCSLSTFVFQPEYKFLKKMRRIEKEHFLREMWTRSCFKDKNLLKCLLPHKKLFCLEPFCVYIKLFYLTSKFTISLRSWKQIMIYSLCSRLIWNNTNSDIRVMLHFFHLIMQVMCKLGPWAMDILHVYCTTWESITGHLVRPSNSSA